MSFTETAKGARDWALTKLGCRYSQAKRTLANIFDCSSLVARAYSAMGKAWKYGGKVPLSCNEVYDDDFELIWPATYAAIGKKFGGLSVIAKAKQPGDLQFLHTIPTSRPNKITHVTMVASESKIVHARGTAYGVRTDAITHYAGKVCALVRYNPACDLILGHKGFRTAAMQKALNAKAGASLSGDGEFGPKTQAAVKAFQKAAGLSITGKGDAATLTALGLIDAVVNEPEPADGTDADQAAENNVLGARVLRMGDDGEDVAQLQEGFLTLGGATAGYDLGAFGDNGDGVDGEYGAKTAACVLLFQTRSGLPGSGEFDAETFIAFTVALAALLVDEVHEPTEEDAEQSEVIVYPSAGYIPDVSANQRTFRVNQVAEKCLFTILRARVSGKTDSTYKERAAALHALGHPHWDYDFIKTTSIGDATEQADAMYSLCSPYRPVGYYLDVETLADGVTYTMSREHIRAYVARMRERAAADGVTIKIGLYMGTSRHDSHYKILDDLFDTHWPATWGVNDGHLSRIPAYGDLHQFTSKFDAGSAGFGVPGGRDMNRLTGRKPLSFFTGRAHDGSGYVGVAKITGSTVNIRAGASTGAQRLSTASKGAIFERRAGDVEGWVAINYKGAEAFVSAQHVALITG